MKLKVFVIGLLLVNALDAGDRLQKGVCVVDSGVVVPSYDAIINLGGDCQVAYQLSKHGLRAYALPFDALVTPYESLYPILVNQFGGFMTPENFVFEVNEKGEKYILDKKYGIRLIHDCRVSEKFLEDYEKVAQKYERRIERLFERIRAADYPLFIRKRITKEQAVELRNLLHTMRNGRPFVLAVLDGDKEAIAEDWHFESIRNFYLRQPEPYSWRGDTEAWKEIFVTLGLIKATPEEEKKIVSPAASCLQTAA